MSFSIGDGVQKIKGYRWPGVVVSVFSTLKGETRVVVECTVPEVAGALHIYSPEQLAIGEKATIALGRPTSALFTDFFIVLANPLKMTSFANRPTR